MQRVLVETGFVDVIGGNVSHVNVVMFSTFLKHTLHLVIFPVMTHSLSSMHPHSLQ